MLRRLYFLFPNELAAVPLVDELNAKNISRRYIHALIKVGVLSQLPKATKRQELDLVYRLEWLLWSMNLLLFFVAILALILSLVANHMVFGMMSLLVMFATFFIGEQFAVKTPVVHMDEFREALSNGEVLLMIDVPKHRVKEIEEYIYLHYPVAVVGGVSWTVDLLGL